MRLTVNKAATAELTARSGYQEVTTNLQPRVRQDELEGRPHMVVPMVMLTEGVHAGSNGPLFYPGEELNKTPAVWNHKPVVIYHPTQNGQPVSACDPDVLNARKVGIILNTRVEEGSLKAEAWLEPSRLKKVDHRVLDMLNEGTMVELSTGLFTDNEMGEGEWDGKSYSATARNYRPDHLAILPDQKGACSIADGAGLLRNEETTTLSRAEEAIVRSYRLSLNEQNIGEIHSMIQRALPGDVGAVAGGPWVTDVFETYFVYEKKDKLYRQDYHIQKGEAKVDGLPEEVVRVVSYKAADSVADNEQVGGSKMDKETLVGNLIENADSGWVEEDREALMVLEEPMLEKLAEQAKQKPAKDQPSENEGAEDEDDEEEEKPTGNTTPSVDEFVNNAPPEIRDVLISGVQSHRAEKARLVSGIMANKANSFSEGQLNEMPLAMLKSIADLAIKPEPKRNPVYVGGGAEPTGNASEKPLVAPTLDFEPVAKP